MIKLGEVNSLPPNPGCYLFLNADKKVIYVGKAIDLRKRVTSYFQKKDHDTKTRLLVSEIKLLDFIVTKNEAEALLLENNLIKLHYPRYNIDLKDSRRYAYLRLTDDELPWIEVSRKRDAPGEYFGPFVSGGIRRVVMDTITFHFKILYKKPSPQLRKVMLENKSEYLERVSKVRKILKGKVDELIYDLEKEMKENSAKQNYEWSLKLRNQIEALKTLKEKQVMEFKKTIDAHVLNYTVAGGEVFLLVFNIRQGVVEEKQEFVFEYYEGFFEQFLLQFYDSIKVPDEIIVPEEVTPAFAEYLKKKSGKKVSISVPRGGDKKELLEFVAKNITATFFAGNERTGSLKEALGLEKPPRTIECFDISHLHGANTVASMVTFTDGFPDKANYRKFRIRAPTSSDDLWAMQEVVKRRYSGSLSLKMKKPDLIVIDGGPTQLGVAAGVLKELKLNIPIISLAKQFEEIHVPGEKEPIRLDRKHKGLQLLQAIRDEAHRFANAYRKVLKKRELLGK